ERPVTGARSCAWLRGGRLLTAAGRAGGGALAEQFILLIDGAIVTSLREGSTEPAYSGRRSPPRRSAADVAPLRGDVGVWRAAGRARVPQGLQERSGHG